MTKDQRITPAGAGKTLILPTRSCAEKDHPRRCGENLLMWLARGRQQGSPPQVRGKLSHTSPALISSRITPAGAGKTLQVTLVPIEDKDHPRRCGENVQQNFGMAGKLGSPPQVRGKPSGKSISAHARRITPAGAGKTQSLRSWGWHMTDHPRRCGENRDGRSVRRRD